MVQLVWVHRPGSCAALWPKCVCCKIRLHLTQMLCIVITRLWHGVWPWQTSHGLQLCAAAKSPLPCWTMASPAQCGPACGSSSDFDIAYLHRHLMSFVVLLEPLLGCTLANGHFMRGDRSLCLQHRHL